VLDTVIRFLSNPTVRRLAVLFAATRLALLVAGLAGHATLPPGPALTGDNLRVERDQPAIVAMWARWDSEWYLMIAEEGYDLGGTLSGFAVGYEPADTTGFFPLYPLTIRALAPALGFIGAGVVISNAALAVSLWLLVLLARSVWGSDLGTRAGEAAAIALLLCPATVFHSAVYAESVYLALSLAAVTLAVRGRFACSGLWGALAALTRPFGTLVTIPVLLEWWRARRRSPAGWLAVLAVAGAVSLFMLYCYGLFGDALAFAHRQSRWRGGVGLPGLAVLRWWDAGPTVHGAHGSTLELVAAVAVVAALPAAIRRLPASLWCYLTAGVLIPLSSTLWSFTRIASALFPLYLLLGLWWAEGRRAALIGYAVVSGTLALVGMAMFAAGYWVG
jgi:hypothetical protein